MNERAPPRLGLSGVLNPGSVAVIGASDDKEKFGGRVMYYLVHHGFRGRIVPVNPRRTEVLGEPCVASIRDAGAPVDVALLAIPSSRVLEVMRECAEAGVGACVVMTTGFAEADAAGRAVEAEMLRIVERSGMRLLGPNCMGIINPSRDLALCSSLVLERTPLPKGRLGLISQSGALMVSIFDKAADHGIGFSCCISLGNQSDIDVCEALEAMIEDPRTAVICLYVEGLKDGRRFLALADRARRRGKPLLAVKAGRTQAGEGVAHCHTASLAGSYAVFEAACAEHAVVLLDDPDAMVRLGEWLSRFGALLGAGGLGIISSSGGAAALAVDHFVCAGLPVCTLAAQTTQRLARTFRPSQARNPIDLGAAGVADPGAAARAAVEALAADPGVALSCTVLTTTPAYEETARALAVAAREGGEPHLFIVTPGSAADAVRDVLRRHAAPFVNALDDAVRILGGALQYREFTVRSRPPRPADLPDAARTPSLPHAHGLLDESRTQALLAVYGIRAPAQRLTHDPEDAAAAARSIGFPVALKGVVPGLVHKSDAGAVSLDLGDADAVREAYRRISEAAGNNGARLDGCLVQAMRAAALELILGIQQDPVFGPVVLVGAGGTLVELVRDTVLALAPFSAEQARDLIGSLRVGPLLGGYRGRRALDLDAAADATSRLSWLAHDCRGRIATLDINPLGVGAKGEGVWALDATATVSRG